MQQRSRVDRDCQSRSLGGNTNPDPARRGFAFQPTSANLGFTFAGVEPVDPCAILNQDRHRALESGFLLQRAWSNRAASEGRNPCVPVATDQPFVALVPRTPTVRLATEGARVTILLDAAADRPVPPWSVAAIDSTGRQDREQYVHVSLDRSTVKAGDTCDPLRCHRRPGTRRRNSSIQFFTTITVGGSDDCSGLVICLSIRNRRPSGETSYAPGALIKLADL
jgi:hypothetical protein